MFISDEKVPITDGENTIYIRAKMSFGVEQALLDDFNRIIEQEGGRSSGGMRIGAYNRALLRRNILAWEGPAFDKVPCTPENIERLDPHEPLLEQALQAINERNVRRSPEDKKKSMSNGASGSKASADSLLTTTPKSMTTSRNGSAGRHQSSKPKTRTT